MKEWSFHESVYFSDSVYAYENHLIVFMDFLVLYPVFLVLYPVLLPKSTWLKLNHSLYPQQVFH